MWKMPSGLYLLGTCSAASVDPRRLNLMTLNWATQVALHPKLVAVSVQNDAVTHQLITQSAVFALNILRREDRAMVRKFVKPVEPDDDQLLSSGSRTLRGVAVRTEATGAPVVAGAAAWIDCAVSQSVPVGSHTLFIGEAVGFGFGDPDDEEVEVLRMEDTRMNYGG
jgi:flavin reductase (DIM6/NTAB) family NADH-FMN oxidoreductase RutF